MTPHETWIEECRRNSDVLRSIISNYHPASFTGQRQALPITAPAAEAACENIRREIRKESTGTSPLEQFDKALKENDVNTIQNLFSSTWFGVPESSDCWSIPGFGVLVDLMDSVPEEEEV